MRAAVRAQLADATNGINPNLAAACAAYGVPVVAFDFSPTSQNVFEANITYKNTEESGFAPANLLTIYAAGAKPFAAGSAQKMFTARWSGTVQINTDIYMGVLGENVQNFEPYADAAEDAMIATLNNLSNQSNFSGGGRLSALETASTRAQCQMDGENWIVPVRFTSQFTVVIA